ncbi:ABC transporter ATP-binding protein [Citrobacter freundii]
MNTTTVGLVNTKPIALHVNDLNVALQRNDQRLQTLHNINFKLHQGEILGLVGESGAGKSLLLKTLVNQLPPGFVGDQDAIRFFPDDVPAGNRLKLGSEVTFIPQDPMNALNPIHTVMHHFHEQLSLLRLPAVEICEKVIDIMRAVNLSHPEELLSCYPHQLSGGMAQRILIALAFVTEPRLVICDEIMTALDVINQQHVITMIAKMQARYGTSILFVTHDLAFATQHCHQLMVMYAGEIIETGTASDVMRHPAHPYTRALIKARPSLNPDWQYITGIPGNMPTLEALNAESLCRFAPRCDCQQPLCLIQPLPRHKEIKCHFSAQLPVVAAAVDATPQLSPHQFSGHSIPFLRVEGMGKEYVERKGWRNVIKPVLSDVNFTVSPGEFIGLLGESGSGKSTLARLMMGLESPTQGRILLNGKVLPKTGRSMPDSIQLIFQNNAQALNPHRNVANILTQGMENKPFLRSERKQRAEELADLVGLSHKLLDKYPQQLSGGQRQRVNIGRALCTMPQLLIADEIVSGLDVSIQARILNLLLALRKKQKFALLLISHDLNVVNYLCSKVIVLHKGFIAEQGKTTQVLHEPESLLTQELIKNSHTGSTMP